MGAVRDYVELSRLSNLPTVLSNVLTGIVIGGGDFIVWKRAALVGLGVSLMYVAGMALNDVADAASDARERPGRPIPSGRVPRRAAVAYGIAMLVAGLALTALSGVGAVLPGAGLAACIVAYDLLHKRFAASVILMGACRGLVYMAAAGAVGPPADWTVAWMLAACLGAYVVVLTIVARRETGGPAGARRWLALALPLIALAPLAFAWPGTWGWTILAAAVLVVWLARAAVDALARPPRIGAAVAAWLAGICFIDGVYLTVLDRPLLALAAAACFVLTLAGHRAVAGT